MKLVQLRVWQEVENLGMPSFGMLRRVARVKTGVSEELLRRNTTFLRGFIRLLGTANIVPSAPILVTLIMDATLSSETSVLTRTARRNIPEDDILHNYIISVIVFQLS
jgi:hypothetical protein